MIPVLFGAAAAPLYGVYHEPVGTPRREAVVLCPPYGHEYIRSHRAFRLLADRLADSGVAVLRFDYRGTGDSAGDIELGTAEAWQADTEQAIDEVRDMSGAERVALVGLRLGALVAAHAAAAHPATSRLVLWDPLLSGADARLAMAGGSGDLHVNGFALPAALLDSFDVHPLPSLVTPGRRVLHLATHERAAIASLRAAAPHLEERAVPISHDWNYVDNDGAILVPIPAISAIAEWIV